MKTIIAGSRSIENPEWVHDAIEIFNEEGFVITELVSGTAKGVDKLAESICEGKLPIKRFPPDWKSHGKKAGIITNSEMAEYADALIAIWDGFSTGTKNMVKQARKKDNIQVILLVDASINKYWISKK